MICRWGIIILQNSDVTCEVFCNHRPWITFRDIDVFFRINYIINRHKSTDTMITYTDPKHNRQLLELPRRPKLSVFKPRWHINGTKVDVLLMPGRCTGCEIKLKLQSKRNMSAVRHVKFLRVEWIELYQIERGHRCIVHPCTKVQQNPTIGDWVTDEW